MKYTTINRWLAFKKIMLACFMSLLMTSGTMATPTDGVFELESDANAIDESSSGAPDDWGTPPLSGSAKVFAFEDDTALPDSIFTGGRKDTQDIPDLGWKNGTILDKGNILHAYAAAYIISSDLVLTFGADRFGNTGDAFMGFWFYKAAVSTNPDGTFSGVHTAKSGSESGDILIQVNYLQSANEGPEILVLEWDPTCNKAANNMPNDGQCAAKNLLLLKRSNALCDPGTNQVVCATTNTSPSASPWPYTPKAGPDDIFPEESFFEGGVNITQLLGSETCFSSFAAETRASSSISAQLKDFVVGDFELCSVDISKTCGQAQVNSAETGYDYDFNGIVTNDGVGTLYNVVVTDNEANQTFALGTIASGDTKPYSGSFGSTQNGVSNTVTVTAAATPAGASTVTDNGGDDCDPISLSPMISVTKNCSSSFQTTNNGIFSKVSFSGMVCNTTENLTLENVSVTDDSGTTNTSDDVVVLSGITLDPKDTSGDTDCKMYSGSYIPLVFTNTNDQTFSDTVTAFGQLKIDGTQATNTSSATCPICPAE